ncbi:Aldehyde dehydrogenase [Sphingobium indicum BiD32]|uniref:Aldehyde dehydrogenase n=1 Tax=Sphingobium indicum BiD32 TaxID=1301087 RepID=N1MTJ0_9SPHN|nr:aldehyde dehydrogenase family protein [Sphingobium indicum]CCW20079.1 Aldehyde dehydrogenase [Sphingobium indicum BiD32]
MSISTMADNGSGDLLKLNDRLDSMKAAFLLNPYPPLEERRDHLRALISMLVSNRQRIRDALRADFHSHSDLYADLIEMVGPVERAHAAIGNLEKWMAHEERYADPALYGDGKAYVEYQPKGVIGSIVPWNFPVELACGPLSDILAAGNRAMIKPSEFTPVTSSMLREIIGATFDEDHVHVVEGGEEMARHFSAQKWDHLLYIGSTRVGRLVMKAAAENLVPVTLELGGKCPALLTKSGVNPKSVASILGLKTMKNGQACVSADYALVPSSEKEKFLELVLRYSRDTIPGFFNSDDCTGIISRSHFDRIQALIEDARSKGAEIISLDESVEADASSRRMALHLVIDPSPDARVTKEEVFGPVLPIIWYDELDDAIALINRGERPLAIYIFSEDKQEIENVLRRTISGGVTVNGGAIHGTLSTLGFGGIGGSGMGRHHGWDGFREFSNARAIFVRGEQDNVDILYPPYGDAVREVVDSILT